MDRLQYFRDVISSGRAHMAKTLEEALAFPSYHGVDSFQGLYFDLSEVHSEKTSLKWIPYYAFANRGASDMLVWVRVKL